MTPPVTYRDQPAVANALTVLDEVARCYRTLMETFDPTQQLGAYDAGESAAYYRAQLIGIEHAMQIIRSTQRVARSA